MVLIWSGQVTENVMRRIFFLVLTLAVGNPATEAQMQTPTQPPQTARQALVEMFLGKEADAFTKHLPEDARHMLIRKGESAETSIVQRISMLGRQMTAQGGHLETFDVGRTLLTSEQQGREKTRVEVLVEHDNLMGENDEIELSIQIYKNGEPEFLPVIPRLTFSMTQEKEIWRLSEVTVAAHVPLTDPDYVKGIRKEEDEGNEKMASMRVSVIASAELAYSASNPARGYTSSLTDLFGKSERAETSDQSSELYPSGWGTEEVSGYRLSISGCDGSPASKFQIVAVPADSESQMKTFCTDESGTVRFETAGKDSDCLKRGKPFTQPAFEMD
jgi:hypothetical protein